MTKRLIPWTLIAIAIACAGGQSGGSAPAAAPTERQRLVNLVPFDVANCAPKAIELSKPINEYGLQAAFRAARPYIQECLTDSRTYDASKPTRGKVTTTVDGSGTKVDVTGEGLQPAAKTCIEKALGVQLAGVAPLAEGAKPATFTGPFERSPDTAVRFGVNDASDVEGTIRLALPQSCACFEPYRTKTPPQLTGPVEVLKADIAKFADRLKLPDGGTPSSQPVTSSLQPSATDADAAKLAKCINDKVQALPLKSSTDKLIVPAQFLLINSNATDPMPTTAMAQLQFAQLDANREQRQAEAFAALGRRQKVADDYDRSVTRFQTNAKSKSVDKRRAAAAMLKDLKAGCATLVKSDDEYTHTLETQAGVEQRALELARTLKATDASWADAESASAGALADTQKQLDASKQLRAANEKACPKEKY